MTGRCETCRFWIEDTLPRDEFSQQPSDTEWPASTRRGWCDLIGWGRIDPPPPKARRAVVEATADRRASASLVTRADFGCVEHEPREQ